MNNRQAAN